MNRDELKGKQTPGAVSVRMDTQIYGMGGGYFCASTRGTRLGEYDASNAALYAEAHNVANETMAAGNCMWPLDLLDRVKELEARDPGFYGRAAARLQQRVQELEVALGKATKFVDDHSASWYITGQDLLTECRAVLNKKPDTNPPTQQA